MSNDCISRQAALDAAENCEPGEETFVIKSLPSAQPERKTGHWLVKQDHNGSTYGECSQCHSIQYAGHTPYCPYCGAEMTEGDDNEQS